MSHNHFIRTSLNLEDKNITFEKEFCQKVEIKGLVSLLYFAILSYKPTHCPNCGIINKQFSIVKNGFLTSRLKWLSSAGQPTFIQLKKQRFLCRECQTSFVATSSEVETDCFIANKVKQSIAIELEDNISMKDLARRHGVSPTTTTRILVQRGKEHAPDFNYLPANLCFDEFKSVKHVTDKMSFIFCDAVTHQIIDILPNRRQTTLRTYFSRYDLQARAQVKSVVVDMNAAYFPVITELFPNAQIIIDRFHVVQLLSRSLNQTRVTVMKDFFGNHYEKMKDYRKLKRYWRLMLKSSTELNYQDYHYQRLFKKPMPETEIIDYLISLDVTLGSTYHLYQELLYYSQKNDFDGFKNSLESVKPEVSHYMQTSVKTLKKHLNRIENTFKYSFSNGPLEGIINKIKVIKRTAYGYRSFWHFKHRILVSFNAINQKDNSTYLSEVA